MENLASDSLKGHLLVAMPALNDPNFDHSVSCICEHTKEGAVGLIINRVQRALSAKNIFDELNIESTDQTAKIPIHIGGPVHIDEIFILHGPPFEWKACLPITPHIAMTNSIDILKAIAIEKGPDDYQITLGCAGWAAGQLEYEIMQNAWLTYPVDQALVFSMSVEARWEGTLESMGVDPASLSGTAGHA